MLLVDTARGTNLCRLLVDAARGTLTHGILVDTSRNPARYFNIVMRIMIMDITIIYSKR